MVSNKLKVDCCGISSQVEEAALSSKKAESRLSSQGDTGGDSLLDFVLRREQTWLPSAGVV